MDQNRFTLSGRLLNIKVGATKKGVPFADFSLESRDRNYGNILSFVCYGDQAEDFDVNFTIGNRVLLNGRIRSKQLEDRTFPVFIVETIDKLNDTRTKE